jgi:effector-binding domain-containing protein
MGVTHAARRLPLSAITIPKGPSMTDQPRIETRSALPYVGIPVFTSMAEEAREIEKHLAELQQWMQAREIAPSGPMFVRYRMIDMPERMEIEVCLPVDEAPPGDGRVRGNEVPEGRYAVLVHKGPLDGLVEANGHLQRWARQEGLEFQTHQRAEATDWTSRIETYLSDPSEGRPQTEIAYLLKA